MSWKNSFCVDKRYGKVSVLIYLGNTYGRGFARFLNKLLIKFAFYVKFSSHFIFYTIDC